MVDIIGGDTPELPSGEGGSLGAHVGNIRGRLYLLNFQVIQRYAGIELIETRAHWYGGKDYAVRLTPVSKNPDTVLGALIGRAKPDPGGDKFPVGLQMLPEGETYSDGTTIGRSKYLLMWPTIRKTVGLDFKITATRGRETLYELRATSVCNDPAQIMAELYKE